MLNGKLSSMAGSSINNYYYPIEVIQYLCTLLKGNNLSQMKVKIGHCAKAATRLAKWTVSQNYKMPTFNHVLPYNSMLIPQALTRFLTVQILTMYTL